MAPRIIIQVVNALKSRYPVKVILEVFNIPKYTYYRWKCKNYELSSIKKLNIFVINTTIPMAIGK